MSSICNFMAQNVVDATNSVKIKVPIKKRLDLETNKIISQAIQSGSIIKSLLKPLARHRHKKEKPRMWPESSIQDFSPEPLGLEEGELVQIRSKEEIFATLDEDGKYRGLLFMREMAKFCGQRHRVFKIVKKIQLESTLEMREMKSPTVFLEGVFCNGEYHDNCDRSCFLYWKEPWLKRVDQ